MIEKGLNSFQIKIIGLVLMTLDHIHYMFTGIIGVPNWFSILGRIVAPLFIFIVANAMRYTRSREKYLLRLWIGSVVMNILNMAVNSYFYAYADRQVINNIFSTLFIISLFIYSGEKIRDYIKEKNIGKVFLFIFIILVPFILGGFYVYSIKSTNMRLIQMLSVVSFFVPSVLTTEGGIMFIVIGIGFYLFRKDKVKNAIFYLIISGLIAYGNMAKGITLTALFSTNVQWFMVFALPIILLYNNKKGKDMKYLFYIYYPVHIYALYFLSIFVANN